MWLNSSVMTDGVFCMFLLAHVEIGLGGSAAYALIGRKSVFSKKKEDLDGPLKNVKFRSEYKHHFLFTPHMSIAYALSRVMFLGKLYGTYVGEMSISKDENKYFNPTWLVGFQVGAFYRFLPNFSVGLVGAIENSGMRSVQYQYHFRDPKELGLMSVEKGNLMTWSTAVGLCMRYRVAPYLVLSLQGDMVFQLNKARSHSVLKTTKLPKDVEGFGLEVDDSFQESTRETYTQKRISLGAEYIWSSQRRK